MRIYRLIAEPPKARVQLHLRADQYAPLQQPAHPADRQIAIPRRYGQHHRLSHTQSNLLHPCPLCRRNATQRCHPQRWQIRIQYTEPIHLSSPLVPVYGLVLAIRTHHIKKEGYSHAATFCLLIPFRSRRASRLFPHRSCTGRRTDRSVPMSAAPAPLTDLAIASPPPH